MRLDRPFEKFVPDRSGIGSGPWISERLATRHGHNGHQQTAFLPDSRLRIGISQNAFERNWHNLTPQPLQKVQTLAEIPLKSKRYFTLARLTEIFSCSVHTRNPMILEQLFCDSHIPWQPWWQPIQNCDLEELLGRRTLLLICYEGRTRVWMKPWGKSELFGSLPCVDLNNRLGVLIEQFNGAADPRHDVSAVLRCVALRCALLFVASLPLRQSNPFVNDPVGRRLPYRSLDTERRARRSVMNERGEKRGQGYTIRRHPGSENGS